MAYKKVAKPKEEEINHWGKLGVWDFHVCKDPQVLEPKLQYIASEREKKRG